MCSKDQTWREDRFGGEGVTVRGRTKALMDVLTHIHMCDNGRVLLTHIVPTINAGFGTVLP